MLVELSKKIKDVTGAIAGIVAIIGLVWAGWLTFSGFLDSKVNLSIAKFEKNINSKINSKIDSQYEKLENALEDKIKAETILSNFVEDKINVNIKNKLNNPLFLKKVNGKLDSVVKNIDDLYQVDSGYSSILSFDFKSLESASTKVKFYADPEKQRILLSAYPIGNNNIKDDDFTIYLDNKSQNIPMWGYISGKDITDFLSKDGAQSKYMHSLRFIPNTKNYIRNKSDKIVKTLEVFILVKNIKR